MRLCMAIAGLALVLSSCTKTETVSLEIAFDGATGDRVEVFQVDACPMPLVRPAGAAASFSMGEWEGLELDGAGAVVVLVTDGDTCITYGGCAQWDEGQETVRVVVDTATELDSCGADTCCRGECVVSCSDAGTDDSGPDGAQDDAGMDAGDDAWIDASLPSCVSAVVQSVTAGRANTCAISNGLVYCWGENDQGQSAPGDTRGIDVPPTEVTGLGTGDVEIVAAGEAHTCALQSGDVYCWGDNGGSDRRLGVEGSTRGPVMVPLGGGRATDLSVGFAHACAVVDGEIWCWGRNFSRDLGRGNDTTDQDPGPTNPPTLATRALAGVGNGCGWSSDGSVTCWGYNAQGAVGVSRSGAQNPTEIAINPGLPPTSIVAMATSHSFFGQGVSGFQGNTCVVADNKVFCWGTNLQGAVGIGVRDETIQRYPIRVGGGFINPPESNDWLLAVGGGTTCAARRPAEDGPRQLFCWGEGGSGELFGVSFEETAYEAPPLLPDVDDVAVGGDHVCAITGGYLYCWGDNSSGQADPSSGGGTRDSPECVSIR